MDRKEAIQMVADGHTVYTEEGAQKACEAFGVTPIKGYPMHSDPPGTHKGLTMQVEGAVCVSALELGHHIASELGLTDQVQDFLGRGTQAREYARVLAEWSKANV